MFIPRKPYVRSLRKPLLPRHEPQRSTEHVPVPLQVLSELYKTPLHLSVEQPQIFHSPLVLFLVVAARFTLPPVTLVPLSAGAGTVICLILCNFVGIHALRRVLSEHLVPQHLEHLSRFFQSLLSLQATGINGVVLLMYRFCRTAGVQLSAPE